MKQLQGRNEQPPGKIRQQQQQQQERSGKGKGAGDGSTGGKRAAHSPHLGKRGRQEEAGLQERGPKETTKRPRKWPFPTGVRPGWAGIERGARGGGHQGFII